MKRLLCWGLISVLATVCSWPATAQLYPGYYCSEPREPFCLSGIGSNGGFDSDSEYSTCKFEVEQYISALDNWQDCIANAAKKKADEAVKAFNCRVADKGYCF